MDEQTLFRTTHEDVEPLTAAQLEAGHAALLQQAIHGNRRFHVSEKRRVARRIGFASLAAGAAAAVLIGTSVIGPAGVMGGAEPAAAAVLQAAAVATIASSDPVVNVGEYLVVTSDSVGTASGGLKNGTTGDYQYRNQSTLYIPADRSDEWVGVYGKSTIEKTFGADSETVARDWFDSITAENGTAPDVLRAEGGDFYNDNDNDFDEAMFALLPRDPRMLLNRIYLVTLGTGPSADAEALVFIGDSLRTGLAPADLRAAFYKAAALIPGVTLTEGQATLDGRTGVAIGRFEPGWQSRQEIIIDPDTGLMIGEREISYATDADFPPGTVWRWTSIVTTVESSAPTGGLD